MLVAFNLKGETIHHAIDVDTTDFREAIAAVKGHHADSNQTLDRCFAVIDGGKKSTPVPILELPPQHA